MVLVYVLEDEDDQFLYRTTCGVRVDALVAELVDVWNLRQIIRRAANACAPARGSQQRACLLLPAGA